jgi:hypothetical protein
VLDKSGAVWYYNTRKRKETKVMEKYFKNKRTGEKTESHAKAMEWYRAKDEVEIWGWSETLGEWICRMEWVW